ncbi:MAG: histidinol-phosphatase [Clostridia bacterium]|nr:histidinol-phosphatase [Clostridia bacterium]
MITLQNLHTHSQWCDGKNGVEELLLNAMEQGFDSVGFSGHSPMFYAPEHGIAEGDVQGYIADVRTMKDKYRGQMEVFCGIELDLYSRLDLEPYDYIIGSVHYLKIHGEYVGFDRNAATVKSVIDTYFGGDGLAYAKAYYQTLATLPTRGRIDVVGHFDLITKHAENVSFFDEDSPAYRRLALEAIEALLPKAPLFEINTGAIARGYRTTPYPSAFLLREIQQRGGGIIISSDCHDMHRLGQSFGDAIALARECGFTHTHVLTEQGFVPISLNDMERKLKA